MEVALKLENSRVGAVDAEAQYRRRQYAAAGERRLSGIQRQSAAKGGFGRIAVPANGGIQYQARLAYRHGAVLELVESGREFG